MELYQSGLLPPPTNTSNTNSSNTNMIVSGITSLTFKYKYKHEHKHRITCGVTPVWFVPTSAGSNSGVRYIDISTLLKNIDKDNLENIDINIDMNRAILENIDIDKDNLGNINISISIY